MNAIITRSKLAPTPGTNYRAAWRWLYTVDYGRVLPNVGAQTANFDTLAAARSACVRNGFKPVEAWKQRPPSAAGCSGPMLLGALHEVRRCIVAHGLHGSASRVGYLEEAQDIIRAAIAKATGA